MNKAGAVAASPRALTMGGRTLIARELAKGVGLWVVVGWTLTMRHRSRIPAR